ARARGVTGDQTVEGLLRRRARDEDESTPARALHVRKRRAADAHVRHDVALERLAELVVAERLERTGPRSADVADDDVEPPERRRGLFDETLTRPRLREVVLHGVHARAQRLQLLLRFSQRLFTARADGNVCAFARELHRARAPKSFARRADGSNAAFQSEVHARDSTALARIAGDE